MEQLANLKKVGFEQSFSDDYIILDYEDFGPESEASRKLFGPNYHLIESCGCDTEYVSIVVFGGTLKRKEQQELKEARLENEEYRYVEKVLAIEYIKERIRLNQVSGFWKDKLKETLSRIK